LKKKLLSPIELKKFRAEQEEARRLRAEQLEKKNKRLSGPKELLDPKPVEEVVKEPIVEVVKEPIELLQERVEEFASQYNEELAQLEVRLANKVELDDINLQPIQNNIKRLRESISELPEVKYYDEDLEKLTERVDQLQVSGSEIFQQHGESLKEIKKVTHQMLLDLDTLSKVEIPEAFDPTDIQNDITATKETFYERVAELKKELSELPEVKYYDEELTELQERIEGVRNSIPELPEVKSYDDEIGNLSSLLEDVKASIPELPEVRYYEGQIAELQEAIKEVERQIPELPEVKSYDEDIKALREEIKGVEGQIPEVPELPEIKNYDGNISSLNKNLDKIKEAIVIMKSSLRNVSKTVDNIPERVDWSHEIEYLYDQIEKLKERPVNVKEDADPLLPLEQNFVTFEDLSKHYRTFVTRIQQQLMSLGGGGEVNLRYLDDIDRASIVDGRVLSYDAATKKFKFISPGAASSLWSETVGGDIYRNSSVGINTADPQYALHVIGDTNIVGILSATNLVVDSITVENGGDINVSGTITATTFIGDFVDNVDKTLEYQTGSLSTITTAEGTKTFYYNNAGFLTSIVGTGIYPSKTFTYDGNDNLINVNVL
jgi:prefoldin subunit 5